LCSARSIKNKKIYQKIHIKNIIHHQELKSRTTLKQLRLNYKTDNND